MSMKHEPEFNFKSKPSHLWWTLLEPDPKPELISQKQVGIKQKTLSKNDLFDFRISLLAGLGLGCGGSQRGKAAPLGDLFLALLFGLLSTTEGLDLISAWTLNNCKKSCCPLKPECRMDSVQPNYATAEWEEAASYLHPLGQQLGILRGFLLVLLGAPFLQSNATALVLQHTRSYQSLNPGSFSSGLLACKKTLYSISKHQFQNRKIAQAGEGSLVSRHQCRQTVLWSCYFSSNAFNSQQKTSNKAEVHIGTGVPVLAPNRPCLC